MDNKVRKYLYDILETVNETLEEAAARSRRYDVFVKDRVFRKFVQTNIGIIGEATGKILKLQPDISITSVRSIVNARNLIIHSYDSLDPEIMWGIVINHLPVLKHEVESLLEK